LQASCHFHHQQRIYEFDRKLIKSKIIPSAKMRDDNRMQSSLLANTGYLQTQNKEFELISTAKKCMFLLFLYCKIVFLCNKLNDLTVFASAFSLNELSTSVLL
jgi:hypothetical protein